MKVRYKRKLVGLWYPQFRVLGVFWSNFWYMWGNSSAMHKFSTMEEARSFTKNFHWPKVKIVKGEL